MKDKFMKNGVFSLEYDKETLKYMVLELQEESQKQKEVIDRTINAIDLVIELIKQQPTKDDRWILNRLNGFKIILENKEIHKIK